MKAARFHQHGGPETLRVEEVPDPAVGPGEVLVRVRACALNHLDLWARRGLERVMVPIPHISGSDVAGEIVAAAAPDLAEGTRVMLQPGMSCGPIDLNALFSIQLTIMGSYMGTKGELLRAARLLFEGRVKPVVDRTYPLSEAAAAQRRLEASEQFGKIVLEV